MTGPKEKERELPPNSEIEHFVRSSTWKYIAEEIGALMMQAAVENDELDPNKQPTEMARNQGRIGLGKMILDMPAQMTEENNLLAAQRKQEEEEHEDDNES